jgi:heme-degrading monooxygenase HmoA
MTEVYTAGVWTVKAGREEEFIRLWRRLGERTLEDFPDAAGTLLRDRDRPNRFISFGPWASVEEVQRWRASPAFRETVRELDEVLEGFEPGTLDVTLRIGGSLG